MKEGRIHFNYQLVKQRRCKETVKVDLCVSKAKQLVLLRKGDKCSKNVTPVEVVTRGSD